MLGTAPYRRQAAGEPWDRCRIVMRERFSIAWKQHQVGLVALEEKTDRIDSCSA
jgi:hypothetical protein